MKVIYVILLILISNKMRAQEEYVIVNNRELQKSIFSDNRVKIHRQIKNNLAFVYKMKDKRFALIPQQGEQAMIFESEKALDKLALLKKYPVGLETNSFYEKHRDLVINMDEGIKVFMKDFFERMEMEPIPLDSHDENDLIRLSGVINEKLKKSQLGEIDLELLGLFMNNFLKNRCEGELEWELVPEHTLNMFYVPWVKRKKTLAHKYMFWKAIHEQIEFFKKTDLVDLFRTELSKVYDLFLSPEQAYFLKTGEVPEGTDIMINWYRSTTWTESDKKNFFAKLNSVDEGFRPLLLRVQADHLIETKNIELLSVAENLLRMIQKEHPDDMIERCNVFNSLGKIYAYRNDFDNAIDNFKQAVEFEKEYPAFATTANLNLAEVVVKAQKTALYSDIQKMLMEEIADNGFISPIEDYIAYSVLSVISGFNGDLEKSKYYSQIAEESVSKQSCTLWNPKLNSLGIVKERKKWLDKQVSQFNHSSN